MPETDPSELEFQHVMESVDALHSCAVEHEAKQAGPEKEPCFENRAWIVAMAAHRLGLSLGDIGSIAEYLVDIEVEHAAVEEAVADDSSDHILDAGELE